LKRKTVDSLIQKQDLTLHTSFAKDYLLIYTNKNSLFTLLLTR